MEKKDIEDMMTNVRENDESMFYTAVNIIVMADDKAELDSICETIVTIGKSNGIAIDTHQFMQRRH